MTTPSLPCCSSQGTRTGRHDTALVSWKVSLPCDGPPLSWRFPQAAAVSLGSSGARTPRLQGLEAQLDSLCTQFQSAASTPCSFELKHGSPSKVALVRPNDRPISLSGVRAHAGPATEAETRQQNLPQRKPGRVVSIPVPKLTQALPCMAAFPCPLPWTDSPFSVSASTGPLAFANL